MNSVTDLILDYSLIQVSEVDSSVTMEKEGLQCCFDLTQGVTITSVATDRHTSVASLMKKNIHLLIINMMYGMWLKVLQKN